MKYNDLDLKSWKELDINIDSLRLIGERDKSGKHANIYHGNFIPQIPNQLIRRYSKEQEIILDIFMGSGTTFFECEKLNRKFIGFNINEEIIDYIRSKMESSKIEYQISDCDITNEEQFKKEINTVRNDFIETLIFEKNNNILPTLNHCRGVDFFINGQSFDQKVAKSPTNEFKRKYKNDWKLKAIKNPQIVAGYLYKYQDEGSFGADYRLLIVYLDENVAVDRIKKIIDNFDLDKPREITFSYKHKTQGTKTYKVSCYIILLYNEY